MREDEFARYAERARQFTDGHEGIGLGIDHTLRVSRNPRRPTIQSIFETSLYAARRVA